MSSLAERPRRADLVGPAVFAALLIATFGALALSQHLKREPLVLDRFDASSALRPRGPARTRVARIHFRLTRSDRANVAIIDSTRRVVRTLAREQPFSANQVLTFRWNGRTNAGEPAPSGTYRVRVRLLGQDRILIPSGRIELYADTSLAGGGSGGSRAAAR